MAFETSKSQATVASGARGRPRPPLDGVIHHENGHDSLGKARPPRVALPDAGPPVRLLHAGPPGVDARTEILAGRDRALVPPGDSVGDEIPVGAGRRPVWPRTLRSTQVVD